MADRVRVTIDLRLTLRLTRRQALRASSGQFKARLRSALAFSSAKEALTEALDFGVESLTLRDDRAGHTPAAIQDPAAPTTSDPPQVRASPSRQRPARPLCAGARHAPGTPGRSPLPPMQCPAHRNLRPRHLGAAPRCAAGTSSSLPVRTELTEAFLPPRRRAGTTSRPMPRSAAPARRTAPTPGRSPSSSGPRRRRRLSPLPRLADDLMQPAAQRH
jgi:hypothetical protein